MGKSETLPTIWEIPDETNGYATTAGASMKAAVGL